MLLRRNLSKKSLQQTLLLKQYLTRESNVKSGTIHIFKLFGTFRRFQTLLGRIIYKLIVFKHNLKQSTFTTFFLRYFRNKGFVVQKHFDDDIAV